MKNSTACQNDNGFMLLVNEPDKVLNFLTKKLGFTVSPADTEQKGTLNTNLKCITLKNSYGNQYLFAVKRSYVLANKNICSQTIVINTDDCLKEYYNLKKADEITFYSKPKYLPEGLAFEASDKWGNEYILLEKRNYSDN
ncbi:MAG: hypothetical protein ACHQIM_00300 [Sphingobacteriales bacterium]